MESRLEIHTPSAVAAARGTVFRTSVDENVTTRSEVLRGRVGVEAMGSSVELHEGEGTLVRRDESPSPPRKLLPPPDVLDLKSHYTMMPLSFNFERVSDASHYRVMLARDSLFKDVVKEKVIKPHEALDIISVNDGLYFLQSQSIDTDGLEGIPLKAAKINVRTNPLPPVASLHYIFFPLGKAGYKEKLLEFNWPRVRDAARYHVQVAEDSGFNSLVKDADNIRGTVYRIENLDYGTYYFRTSSFADDGYEGLWSPVQSFTLSPPPDEPIIQSLKIGEGEIHVLWSNLGEGVTYRIQIARDRDFNDMLLQRTAKESSMDLPKPKEEGTYYIRISGIHVDGHEGSFSSPQSFEIKKSAFMKLF
jgi:hypothetical protein